MNKMKLNLLGRHLYAGKGGLAALVVAASMTVASSQAMAAVACFTTPIPVPQTSAGIYANLFTGLSGVTPASSPGWDLNFWGAGSAFFWVAATTPLTGFVDDGAGVIANLANSAIVGPASAFLTGNSTPARMATYHAGVTNGNLGVRFVEGANTYYAWVNVTTTAPAGLPVTINRWCYENTPATAITVGTTPVSLQKFSVD